MIQPYDLWFNRGGVLVNDFKGHSTGIVKYYEKSFQSGDDADEEKELYTA